MKKAIHRISKDGHDYYSYEYEFTYDEAISWLSSLNMVYSEFMKLLDKFTIRQLSKKLKISYIILSAYIKALNVDTHNLQQTRLSRTRSNKTKNKESSISKTINDLVKNKKDELIKLYDSAISKDEIKEYGKQYSLLYKDMVSLYKSLNLEIPHASVFRHRKILHNFDMTYGTAIAEFVSEKVPVRDIIRRLNLDTQEQSNLLIYMRERYNGYKSDSRSSSLFGNIIQSSTKVRNANYNKAVQILDSNKNVIIKALYNKVMNNQEIISEVRKICDIKISAINIMKYIDSNIYLSDISIRLSLIEICKHGVNHNNKRLKDICQKHEIEVPPDLVNFEMEYYIYSMTKNDNILIEYIGYHIFDSVKSITMSLGDEFQIRSSIYESIRRLNLTDRLIPYVCVNDYSPTKLLMKRTNISLNAINSIINEYDIHNIKTIYFDKCAEIAKRYSIDFRFIKEFMIKSEIHIIRNESSYELKFADTLYNIDDSFKRNDRTRLNGKEIDFLYENKNIGIEINPTFTHNSDFGWNKDTTKGKSSTYHFNKWMKAKNADIQLISIFEDNFGTNSMKKFLELVINEDKYKTDNLSIRETNDYTIDDSDYIDIGNVEDVYDTIYACSNNNDCIAIIFLNKANRIITNIRLFVNNDFNIKSLLLQVNEFFGRDIIIMLNNDYGIYTNKMFTILEEYKPIASYINNCNSDVSNYRINDDYILLFRCGYSLCEFK